MANSAEQLKQAVAYIKAGDRRAAVALISGVLKSEKTNVDAWYLLANALTDRAQQIKALENALKIQPGYTRARDMLNKLHPDAAPKTVETIEPEPEPEPDWLRSTADDDWQDDAEDDDGWGDVDDGDDSWEDSIDYGDANAPDDDWEDDEGFGEDDEDFGGDAFDDEGDAELDPRLLDAMDYISAGDDKKAQALARQVLNEDRQNPDAWFVLANAMADTGQDARVKAALEKVLSLQPDNVEARKWLAELTMDLAEASDDEALFDDYDELDYDPFEGIKPATERDFERPKRGQVRVEGERRRPPLFRLLLLLLLIAGGIGAALLLPTLNGTDEANVNTGAEVEAPTPEVTEAPILAEATEDSTLVASATDTVATEAQPTVAEDPTPTREIVPTVTPAVEGLNPNCRTDLDLTGLEVVELAETTIIRGPIAPLERVTGYQYEGYDDGWRYDGQSGETITVNLRQLTPGGELNTQVYVYNPGNQLITQNDDRSEGVTDSLAEITLTQTGTYTIVAGSFSTLDCGDYLLQLQSDAP